MSGEMQRNGTVVCLLVCRCGWLWVYFHYYLSASRRVRQRRRKKCAIRQLKLRRAGIIEIKMLVTGGAGAETMHHLGTDIVTAKAAFAFLSPFMLALSVPHLLPFHFISCIKHMNFEAAECETKERRSSFPTLASLAPGGGSAFVSHEMASS